MALTATKIHRMKSGAIVGGILGLFVFFVALAASNNWASALFIPAAALIGAAQGYFAPDLDDD